MKQNKMRREELSYTYLDGDMISLVTGKIVNVYNNNTQEHDQFLTLAGRKTEQSKKILDAVLTKTRQNKYTKILRALNKSRKEQFTALDDILSGLSKKTGERAEAAIRIRAEIHKHTTAISPLGFAKCTRKLNQVITSLSSMEADIQTAGIADWITDLITVHEEFKIMEKNKIAHIINTNLPTLHEARQQITKHLETLLGCVDMLAEEYPDIYTSMLAEINEIIGDTMAVARMNKTRDLHTNEIQEQKEASNAA